MCDSRLPKQLLSEVHDCMENNVRTSARFGRRRNVSKPASKIASRTWTSTPVLKRRLLRTVQLGLAKSPLGLLRRKPTEHSSTEETCRSQSQQSNLHFHCSTHAHSYPMRGRAFWARIGLTSIFGPMVASPQSEVIIFDFFRRTNNKALNKYWTS